MRNLPNVKHYKATSEQVRHLAKWLAAYELSEAPSFELEEPVSKTDKPDIDIPSRAFDKEIARGQIRLFTPEVAPKMDLIYFAVLKEWDNNEWLIAPFNPFSAPALPGELLLEARQELHLKVLCLWNAHTMSRELVQKSWIEQTLSDEELMAAWSVFKHVAIGAKLPEPLEVRVGPHVLRADDPRIEYQREQTARLYKLTQEEAGDSGRQIRFADYLDYFKTMPLAAGEKTHKSPCVFMAGYDSTEAVHERLLAVCSEFDPLIPRSHEDIRCEWTVDMQTEYDISRIILFTDGIEEPVGYPEFDLEDRLLRIILLRHYLPPHAEPVRSATQIKILILPAGA